jgi:hypothetical protein
MCSDLFWIQIWKKFGFWFFFGFLRIFLVEARENHQITIFSSDQNPKKCKIAILNIDSILNGIFLSLKNMKVLKFAGLKWVYMLKSVEKWLCKIWKYKTVVGSAI